MSWLMTGRECFVLPTSETSIRHAGDAHPIGAPAARTSGRTAAAAVSPPNDSHDATDANQNPGVHVVEQSGAATLVTNPMLAPTLRQPAVRAPETRGAPPPTGARLLRLGTDEAFAI